MTFYSHLNAINFNRGPNTRVLYTEAATSRLATYLIRVFVTSPVSVETQTFKRNLTGTVRSDVTPATNALCSGFFILIFDVSLWMVQSFDNRMLVSVFCETWLKILWSSFLHKLKCFYSFL